MFNIFGKHKIDFVYDQAVLLDINFDEQAGMSPRNILTLIRELEDNLRTVLPESCGVDGDDLSTDDATIYIYGPDADNIYTAIKPVLSKTAFRHVDVTLQYGLAEDPDTKDKKFKF